MLILWKWPDPNVFAHLLFGVMDYGCRSGHRGSLISCARGDDVSRNAQFLDRVCFNLQPNQWNLCRHLSCMSGGMAQPTSSTRSRARCCAPPGAEILSLFSFYSIFPLISCEDEADGVWWNMEGGVQLEGNMTVNVGFDQWWIKMMAEDGPDETTALQSLTRWSFRMFLPLGIIEPVKV